MLSDKRPGCKNAYFIYLYIYCRNKLRMTFGQNRKKSAILLILNLRQKSRDLRIRHLDGVPNLLHSQQPVWFSERVLL